MVPDLGVFGTGVAFGRPGEAEGPGWIQGLVDVSGKALGTCHHRGCYQILTATSVKEHCSSFLF